MKLITYYDSLMDVSSVLAKKTSCSITAVIALCIKQLPNNKIAIELDRL
jgi:hypothetical protein